MDVNVQHAFIATAMSRYRGQRPSWPACQATHSSHVWGIGPRWQEFLLPYSNLRMSAPVLKIFRASPEQALLAHPSKLAVSDLCRFAVSCTIGSPASPKYHHSSWNFHHHSPSNQHQKGGITSESSVTCHQSINAKPTAKQLCQNLAI